MTISVQVPYFTLHQMGESLELKWKFPNPEYLPQLQHPILPARGQNFLLLARFQTLCVVWNQGSLQKIPTLSFSTHPTHHRGHHQPECPFQDFSLFLVRCKFHQVSLIISDGGSPCGRMDRPPPHPSSPMMIHDNDNDNDIDFYSTGDMQNRKNSVKNSETVIFH